MKTNIVYLFFKKTVDMVKKLVINRYTRRFTLSFLLILTPPIHAQQSGDTGVVIKLGHAYVQMAIMALKSLVYFSKLSIRVTFIDDGTLTVQDGYKLGKHIVNSKIISSTVSKKRILSLLKNYKYCYRYRQEHGNRLYTHNTSLFDLPLLVPYEKIIILDADVLFFRKPQEIIDWVNSKKTYYCHMSFHKCHVSTEFHWGRVVLWVLAHEWKTNTPTLFNDGILCTYKSAYRLPVIEPIVRKVYRMKLQNEWISLVIILSGLYSLLQKQNRNSVRVLHPVKYAIITNCNQSPLSHIFSHIAIHYIANWKFPFIIIDSIKLLLRTRCFRKPILSL